MTGLFFTSSRQKQTITLHHTNHFYYNIAEEVISCQKVIKIELTPNGEFLEYYPTEVDPLRSKIFQPQLLPDKDGYVDVPDRPGIGFTLNMELLGRYRVM